MATQLRIARPVGDLGRSKAMYCRGLGLRVVSSFEGHAGFDGVILGTPDAHYHFEFTRCRAHPVMPTPTPEDLLVLYVPVHERWRARCDNLSAAGFEPVASFNPYWDARGRTYEDADGYRIVVQLEAWGAL